MAQVEVKLQEKHIPYVLVDVWDKNNRKRKIHMHGYLIGLEAAFQLKKDNKWHNLVILTGNVGDGKSSLTEGLAAVNAKHSGQKLSLDNVSWATEKFIEKTDRDDNIGTPQWWDESIQGASNKNMAMTKVGSKLKNAFVTKRFKKHTYYLVIDEINEYAWKLIKMADAWIHVKKFGLSRGYFDAYVHKSKIQFIYNAFKYYGKTWNSKEVKNIYPDCKGKFNNYGGLFLDEDEYNKAKMDETRQLESDEENTTKLNEKEKRIIGYLLHSKMSGAEIARRCDCDPSYISKIKGKFKVVDFTIE